MSENKSLQRKQVELYDFKMNDTGNGSISGYVSVFNNVDLAQEIVAQGAFTNSLAEFLTHGFGALNHDWQALPIMFPVRAFEDEKGLFVEMEFHSGDANPEAQHTRKICRERMLAGKSVRFSIGYEVLQWHEEKREGFPYGVRILDEVRLFEASIVNVPANPLAQAEGLKKLPKEKQSTGNAHNFTLKFMERTMKWRDKKSLFSDVSGQGLEYAQGAFDVMATFVETLVTDTATDATTRIDQLKTALAEFSASLVTALQATEQADATQTASKRFLQTLMQVKSVFADVQGTGMEKLGNVMNTLYTTVEGLFNDTQTPIADRVASLEATLSEFNAIVVAEVSAMLGVTDAPPADPTASKSEELLKRYRSAKAGRSISKKNAEMISQILEHASAIQDLSNQILQTQNEPEAV